MCVCESLTWQQTALSALSHLSLLPWKNSLHEARHFLHKCTLPTLGSPSLPLSFLLLSSFPLCLSSSLAVYPSLPSPLPSSQMSRLCEFTHFTSRGPSSPFSTPQSHGGEQNAHTGHLTGALLSLLQ